MTEYDLAGSFVNPLPAAEWEDERFLRISCWISRFFLATNTVHCYLAVCACEETWRHKTRINQEIVSSRVFQDIQFAFDRFGDWKWLRVISPPLSLQNLRASGDMKYYFPQNMYLVADTWPTSDFCSSGQKMKTTLERWIPCHSALASFVDICLNCHKKSHSFRCKLQMPTYLVIIAESFGKIIAIHLF